MTEVIIAQQPLNFSFEKKSVEEQRPWGWESTIWSTSQFRIDSTTIKDGNYSLSAMCKDKCESESYRYAMEVFDLRGKDIQLNAYIKGKDLKKEGSISISYAYEDSAGSDYLTKEASSEKFTGSFDWTSLSVSMKIPNNAKLVYALVNFNGEGALWVDDLELLVDGISTRELRVEKAFTKDEKNWFRKQVHSFGSALPKKELFSEDINELQFFKEAIGNSRIVALGESTHGTHEFFTLKHKLLQFAVEEMGFRVFAIEDHQLIVRQVDEYIKSGEGDTIKSMSGMFGVWARQEVVDMIEWLKEFNQKNPDDMVSFIGFDIQDVNPSIESLENFLKIQDADLFDEIEPSLTKLRAHAKNIFFVQDTLQKQGWIDDARVIFDRISAKKENWLAQTKTNQERNKVLYGIQYVKLIVQFFQEGLHNGQMLYRDEAMAENLSWYLENIQPKGKVIVWAHDVHISRGECPVNEYNMHSGKSMGSFLAKKYKEDFKSFGLSTFTGTYSAFKTYSYKELIESPLFESPEGTIEEVLHQIAIEINKPNLYLPLNNSEIWLDKPVPVRFANHVSFDYSFWPRFVIPNQFDGIFFIDQTTAALLIK
ncbi:erythromycin esterase family protein [Winogradskyella sp.]|uniref:erythromycin esterase family protein n=1 Tax=Winogradskyella sp. TaxID=1883156 RepID=UPI003BABFFC4